MLIASSTLFEPLVAEAMAGPGRQAGFCRVSQPNRGRQFAARGGAPSRRGYYVTEN